MLVVNEWPDVFLDSVTISTEFDIGLSHRFYSTLLEWKWRRLLVSFLVRGADHMLSEKSQWTENGTMFVDLDWLLNASSLLSASAELLVKEGNGLTDSDNVQIRWKEYIEDLYDKNNKPQYKIMHLQTQKISKDHLDGRNILVLGIIGIVSHCAIVTLSSRYSTSKNVVTLKLGSKVTEGHWEWYHSIDCV